MATRRTNMPGKESPAERHVTLDRPAEGKSNITPAVPAYVVYKLLIFTFAMVVAPISTYFITVNTVFKERSSWAGAAAAVMANVVLIGYIVAAVWEDQGEQQAAALPAKDKKAE